MERRLGDSIALVATASGLSGCQEAVPQSIHRVKKDV